MRGTTAATAILTLFMVPFAAPIPNPGMTVTIVHDAEEALISWTPVPEAELYRVYQEGMLIYEGVGTTATGASGPVPHVVIVVDGVEEVMGTICIDVRPIEDWPPPVDVYEC